MWYNSHQKIRRSKLLVRLKRRDIEAIIPHRGRALFLSSALYDDKTGEVTAAFKPRAWMFEGHFPTRQILPGIYQVEAVNLAVAISAMFGSPPDTEVFLRRTGDGEFKRPIEPGSVVIVTGRVTSSEEKRGIVTFFGAGEARVNGKLTYQVTFIQAVKSRPKAGEPGEESKEG